MTYEPRTSAIPLIHRLFEEGTAAALNDAQLAERFVRTRDPEAFAALVGRHGPMVMAVCRGVVGPGGDAEDAFQATFVILLKRLGTFPVGPSLGGWLYRVASRVSRQARIAGARRRRREAVAGPRGDAGVDFDPGHREVLDVIRQEVDRLPDRYRAAVVLCDLEGMTRDEAAGLLGCPPGTVAGRLARGRERLRGRLERRGIAPSVAMPVIGSASWRIALERAIPSAAAMASGGAAGPAALALAAKSTRGALAVPTIAMIALAACVTIGLIATRQAPAPPMVPAAEPPAIAKADPPAKPVPAIDPDDPKLAGHFEGKVIGPDGGPLADARIYVTRQGSSAPDPGPIRTKSGVDGRFTFEAPDMTYLGIDGLPARRPGVLIALADGLAPDSVYTWGETGNSFHSHWDPVKGAELTLRPVRDDVPIRGQILDPRGRPLAGARVRASGLSTPSHIDMDAHLDKFKRSKDQVWMFDTRSIYVPPDVARATVTDAEGRFTLSGLGRDRLAEVSVTSPGLARGDFTVVTRDIADIVLDRDLDGNPTGRATRGANFTARMRAGVAVRGVVRDRETHAPIAGMWVGPRAIDRLRQGDRDLLALTDAEGRFSITGIDTLRDTLDMQAVAQPGIPYLMGQGKADGKADLAIECVKGIPFRLKLVDEAGAAVEAKVEYQPVFPNPRLEGILRGVNLPNNHPVSLAARLPDGQYEGFVLPGPGAVLVTPLDTRRYRPAYVDPKAFFEPGRTTWTAQEKISSYGTADTLIIPYGWVDQHDYAAILLVKPASDSKPLELSATLVRDVPRMVTLVDPEGKPVVGVETQGLTTHPWDAEPRLRSATFSITKLHPSRTRRITFTHAGRKLTGFLLARGDGDAPYTVRMQPWGAVTGRVVDERGEPILGAGGAGAGVLFDLPTDTTFAIRDDPEVGELPAAQADAEGRFRFDRMNPGQSYSVAIYRGSGMFAGMAFENLKLKPGEVRDLGDVRSRPPVDVNGR